MNTERIEGIHLLIWEQDITLKNVDGFRQAMKNLMESSSDRFILDLSAVDYMNSAALGVIANSVLHANQNGKQMVIAGVRPTVEEILTIVRFSTFMRIFRSREEALDDYRGMKG